MEFTLLAPALLFMVLGIAAMALYFTTYVALVHAATEGARASIAGLGADDRAAAALNRVEGILGAYRPLISSDQTEIITGPGTDAGTYQVTISYAPGNLGLGDFFSLWSLVAGEARSGPPTISHTVTVANGGYS